MGRAHPPADPSSTHRLGTRRRRRPATGPPATADRPRHPHRPRDRRRQQSRAHPLPDRLPRAPPEGRHLMPPKKKRDDLAPSTMKELKDTLWKAADKLRGSMDASQYKDVILGLVFLKYVSDAFEERRGQIQAELEAEGLNEEQIAQLIDDVDEYTGHGVFWVSPRARWSYLAEHAKGLDAVDGAAPKSIGLLIDEAMELIMQDNKSLAATLPKIYNRDNV